VSSWQSGFGPWRYRWQVYMEEVMDQSAAERCRDEPMEMADLLKQAAELLRHAFPELTPQSHEWYEQRYQWLKDFEGE
jgi:hypothetical protein